MHVFSWSWKILNVIVGQARKMAAAGAGRLRRAASAVLLRAPRLPARELSAPARLYHKKVRAAGGSAPGGAGRECDDYPENLGVLAEAQPSDPPGSARPWNPDCSPGPWPPPTLDGGAFLSRCRLE